MRWRVLLLVLLAATLAPHQAKAGSHLSLTPALAPWNSDERFGIAFINGAGYGVPDRRYQQAVDAGARWTRWPIYWHEIETSQGRLGDSAYSAQDTVVARDRDYGLKINGVLLGTPYWAATAGLAEVPFPRLEQRRLPQLFGLIPQGGSSPASPPANLYTPVFNPDGTINQSNYWARFVYTTVSRYRGRIQAWELWNEPDLKDGQGQGVFWLGSREDYYQLLKVGYLAAKAADPSAIVLFSGLAYWTDTNFFPYVLNLMAADASAGANNYYFDVLPWHFYVSPYHLYNYALWSRQEMQRRGFSKAIWVNETNIPVCNDTAVDTWLTCPAWGRGTMEEQASFVIQAYALGAAAGLERIFIFQFYDDDVGPHEWYGLIRNDGTSRPSYTAYQVAATYLSNARTVSRTTQGNLEMVTFYDTPLGKVTVVWNTSPSATLASIAASSSQATLVSKYGQEQGLVPNAGSYRFNLPGATYLDQTTGRYEIGGDPYLLVEGIYTKPASRVNPLPTLAPAKSFTVSWSRLDSLGGDVRFDVQFREDAGAWTDWLRDTRITSATFGPTWPVVVSEAKTYYFRSRAKDSSGYIEPYPSGGCECDASITVPYFITGQVWDNRGHPIPWARVYASAAFSATTDITGAFALGVYPPGTYDIGASKDGYGLLPTRAMAVSSSYPYSFFLPPQENTVQNWGFEGSGGVGEWWAYSGNVITSTSYMHSGQKSARLGEVNYTGDSSLWQVGIGISSQWRYPTLAFVYSVLGTPSLGDSFNMTINSAAGPSSYAFPIRAGWSQAWADLRGVQGPVDLTFTFHQASGSSARLFIDEVSLGPGIELPLKLYFPWMERGYAGGW